MKILIFGASGSGTTTLGKEIEKKTDFKHLDVDDYYWKKTEPPFQEKLSLKKRNDNLKVDFKKFENIIVSGSMVSWGKEWEKSFDLAIFIHLNNNDRIKRLENRETERYGEKLLTDKKTQNDSKAFLEWANQYENPDFNGRSLKVHNAWIESLKCNVLRIDGEVGLKEKTEKALSEIKTTGNNGYN
ncbi:AAA family ATPase [Maribacter antarcticus]|uniref:AAA family ATPase n=1 Tax=Maribacter antarcticus TaxID=505250 RepID=UPI00047C7E26|nr:AAA family ATPase [Maribacter antarcticus]